jgi:flagellar motor protein MotB
MDADLELSALRLREVLFAVELARATDLARVGHLNESEKILAEILREGEQAPEVLDLLARIRVRQGRISEAESIWRNALASDPTSEAYKSALARIAEIQARRKLRPVVPIVLGGVLAAFLLLAAAYAFRAISAYSQKPANETKNTATIQPSPVKVSNEDSVPLRLEVRSGRVNNDTDGVTIRFDFGLFPRTVELSYAAKEALDSVGQQLEPMADSVVVHVRGYTSDTRLRKHRTFQDDEALGLARAVTVINYLRSKYRLPASNLIATTSGSRECPYPNDSRENRLRNQTVTIKVTRR